MATDLKDLHPCPIGGIDYGFRSIDCHDLPKLDHTLTRMGVRRPSRFELRLQALHGIVELGKKVSDETEGKRQRALLEDWYELAEPIREDDIDIVDYQERAVELARREADRTARQLAIWPEVAAIEANLERHWPPYHELLSDLKIWDRISQIEAVRLLLVSVDGVPLDRDDRDLVSQAAYQRIERDHRLPLATFAFKLLAPDEVAEKN